jgi:hypothetical protein
MNKFSLSADSRTWWLPAAVAGGIGTVALGAILILPAGGQSATEKDVPAFSDPSDRGAGLACFAQRPPRPYGVEELPQPVCR